MISIYTQEAGREGKGLTQGGRGGAGTSSPGVACPRDPRALSRGWGHNAHTSRVQQERD